MNSILRFETRTMEKIWGSEDWLISAHPNAQTKVTGGKYNGMDLQALYEQQPTLFNRKLETSTEFPLLVKVIDANEDLSVQVHPDDLYAKEHENSLGKTECWYILDTKPENQIIVGQTAKNRKEMDAAITAGKCEDFLKYVPVKKDDFFFIPAGTVHAIKGGTKILEVQQSSDITYRLYDYNRPDDQGNLRELHVEKSLDVIDYKSNSLITDYSAHMTDKMNVYTYTDNNFFCVQIIEANTSFTYEHGQDYVLGVILNDQSKLDNHPFTKYESFIIPHGQTIRVKAGTKMLISYAK
ncbi:MAG: type I phosphomannose isomerase catalytic subunit [Mycoplasmatales bacterium]